MASYYNEIDKYAAQWLRNLIDKNLIAPGDVDERSIADVRADDLKGYDQCHFFAGIGGWSLALRLAGWPDDRPVWTGSCPCQPFSAAGAGKAFTDDRHLWPAWFPLIAQLRPATVFGEQVEAAVGWGWLDAVFADLEGEGYACGATVLPACGVGAPHIRQRLWFVADAGGTGTRRDAGTTSSAEARSSRSRDIDGRRGDYAPIAGGTTCRMADSDGRNASQERQQRSGEQRQQPQDSGAGELVNAAGEQVGLPGRSRIAGATGGFWHSAEWIPCTDGKTRPVGPGSFPLGHGIRNRASKLRAYGNAIVPQAAEAFIRAFLDVENM